MVVTARAEHVGSLLRPPYLLKARQAHAAGALDPAAFKAIEDRAVREVMALQEQVGCPVVTDGELRRDSFQGELAASVDGFAGVIMDAWLWGEWRSDVVGDVSVQRLLDLGSSPRCGGGATWPPRSSPSFAGTPTGSGR